jgi:3-hydroxybutyryl-CoA dehydratase
MAMKRKFNVGDVLLGPVRGITSQRIEWYDSAMLSACTNELRQVGSNIHTDAEFARQEGFPGPNADGMIMTNWCSEMLVSHFGMYYVTHGELRTKFIKPVYLDVLLHVKARITTASLQENGNTVYTMLVWCEDQDGQKLTDGDAAVEVAA